jgi:tRNA(adenine34) deaminase
MPCEQTLYYNTCTVPVRKMQNITDSCNDYPKTDEEWMELALAQARMALDSGEVPVGAVVVLNGAMLSAAFNRPISLCDPTAHAEILALRAAASAVGNYRLSGATLYVTLEPCLMCAGAISHARVSRLVFGASDPKNGAAESLYRIFGDKRLNHVVAVQGGMLREACGEILSGFFRQKRIMSRP